MSRHVPARQLAALLLAAACGPAGGTSSAGLDAGLATAIDSTADTVFARVSGEVPATAIRHLVEEASIAPSADDTTLFTQVFDFEVDHQGRFWAFDFPTKTIFVFGPHGQLIRRIGREGGGPGEFRSNGGMVVLGDTGVAIWDTQNGRVAFMDTAGVFVRSWPVTSSFSTSDGLVTDRTGTLFLKRPVTEPREGEILGRMGLVRLGEGGAFGDSLAPPDLPVERLHYLAVSKDGRGRSSSPVPYAPNYHWAWHRKGYFIVAHGRYEVVSARPTAKPLTIRRDLPPVTVSDEERGDQRARITYNMQQTQPGWSMSGGPALPDTKAPLVGLSTLRDGRIWVRVAAPSERIPEAELTPPRDPKQPVFHFRSPAVYEVFSSEGRFLGRVEFPRRTNLVEAEGNTVWALGRNEDDLPALIRYRIEPALP